MSPILIKRESDTGTPDNIFGSKEYFQIFQNNYVEPK